jgi:DNA-directed RNA polymerase subunit N (RpoN/RPB10)
MGNQKMISRWKKEKKKKERMLPVRCYTCGKILGNMNEAWEKYRQEMKLAKVEEENWMVFFERHSIRRYCCKRVLMTQVPDPNQEIIYKTSASVQIVTEDYPKSLFLAR